MYYAGIDISKYKHDCFIQTNFGDVINDGFAFNNNAEGFRMLQIELEKYGRGNIRIGFEATGNYGINLKLFLEKIGFDFMEINPFLIKEHIKSKSLRKTKTDRLDARAIANYVSSNQISKERNSGLSKVRIETINSFQKQFSIRQKSLSRPINQHS